MLRFPRGRMAVTPVLTGPFPTRSLPSPAMSVLKPTSTPATSVMALKGPGEPSKGTPRSRARDPGEPVADRFWAGTLLDPTSDDNRKTTANACFECIEILCVRVLPAWQWAQLKSKLLIGTGLGQVQTNTLQTVGR